MSLSTSLHSISQKFSDLRQARQNRKEIETRLANESGKMVLRTENLVKKYRQRTVVNHVSIDVTQGEIVGLLGPNGAGKTTTFYMTTGLIAPYEGKIFLNDMDITKFPVYKRAQNGIGYLAQEPSVFRKLSVENNIRAVLEMTNTSKEYQEEKLESLIAEFRLEKVRKNLGIQLSGGERRRTEIARCLAISPKFIMLDEPFAGVDPIAVEDIQYIVYKLKEKNIGILITDHNAPETLSITDRAYLLFEGKILFQGTSEELAETPVVREKYLGRNFVFRNECFPAPFKRCRLLAPEITRELEVDGLEGRLLLKTDRPAFFVFVEFSNIAAHFSDNSFTLLPGEPVKLSFRLREPASRETLNKALRLRELSGCRRKRARP